MRYELENEEDRETVPDDGPGEYESEWYSEDAMIPDTIAMSLWEEIYGFPGCKNIVLG